MAVACGVLLVIAAGTLLWLLVDLRAEPRRRSAAQRERAARLRRSRTPDPRRIRVAASPLPRFLHEVRTTPPVQSLCNAAVASPTAPLAGSASA
jgi:hypothetical protein